MRFAILLVFLALCRPLSADGADAIAPGMSLAAVKNTLHRHGYPVDARKYGMAIAADDKQTSLEFCRIDDDITLVIAYRTRTDKVLSLGVYFVPANITSRLQKVSRDAMEIRFEDGGIYTLKLRRKPDRAASAK
jgi:hypothetical protein